jgi:hypothetical protein
MLAAKEAEVRRLQQQKAVQALQAEKQAEQQAADERSIVVFGVSPQVPESVVRAHFSGCGGIRRCTMLPGRVHAAPGAAAHVRGAYVEFESSRAVLAAMGLTGTQLLDQTIQVGWRCWFVQMYLRRECVCWFSEQLGYGGPGWDAAAGLN